MARLVPLARAVFIAALFVLMPATRAATPLPAEAVSVLAWLQNQIQADGSLLDEPASSASRLQTRSEAALTLTELATAPDLVLSTLTADSDLSTEYLARRIRSLHRAGVPDASAIAEQLAAAQNPDGGFGGTAGFQSNPLDTAWGILAITALNHAAGGDPHAALSYLMAAIDADGGIRGESPEQRIFNSSVALVALNGESAELSARNAARNLAIWLRWQQRQDGSWLGDPGLSAYAAWALQPVVGDTVWQALTSGHLKSTQSADGSWAGDPFVTAVALRVLAYPPAILPPANDSASLSGQVFDQGSGMPLGGVTVSLVGGPFIATDSGGRFLLDLLPAGEVTLELGKPGYGAVSATVRLTAGQTTQAGIFSLSQTADTGTLRGQVRNPDGQPLPGVTITATGATVLQALTDSQGQFEFAAVAPGAVSLEAALTGYQSAEGTADLPAGQTLVFSPTLYPESTAVPGDGHLIGRTVGTDGQALANVNLVVAGQAVGSSGADGRFDLTLLPGEYQVQLTLSGYTPPQLGFTLTAGSVADGGDLVLSAQRTTSNLSGLIKAADSGQALSAAWVEVIGGNRAVTGADGRYRLADLAGLNFDLRVGADGYETQFLTVQVGQPGDLAQDFKLKTLPGNGIDLLDLAATPGEAGRNTDIRLTTTLANTGSAPAAVVLTLEVVNAAGESVGRGSAYPADGSTDLGVLTTNPGDQWPVVLRWNSGQFAPGSYALIARASEAGSISRSNPYGRVLAERRTGVTVSAAPHFGGSLTADPPILQANAQTPVHLSATLQNDGNVDMGPQSYTLTVIDEKAGTVLASQDLAGGAIAVGALQTLSFPDWTPTAGSNYRLEVQAAGSPQQGKIVGTVYVGDAATALFNVDRQLVPTGDQTVQAAIHITGQDAGTGTISDPLAPLIKAAIQKGVGYNDTWASNWTLTNQCLGCHVQTQALVGGELTRRLTSYNAAQRNVLFNAIATGQQANGTLDLSHPQYARTETILGLWALTAWHNQEETLLTLTRAADYLLGQQESGGSWNADGPGGWWAARPANTAFTLKSLIEVRDALQRAPAGAAMEYRRNLWISGQGLSGTYYLASDADNNVYVSNYSGGTVSRIQPDGTAQPWITGLSQPLGVAATADGTLYVTSPSGLYRRNADASLGKLTAKRGDGLVVGPDGLLYMSDYRANRIYRIAADGTTSDHLVGGGLSGPEGLAFSPAGDLLVANYSNRKILRIKPDKTVEVANALTNGNPRAVVRTATGWLVGTTNGLYRYNEEWQGERLSFADAEGLTVTADGRIVTGDGAAAIYTMSPLAIDTAAKLTPLDNAIGKATDWLLNDANTDAASNLQLAHRLIGLGAAEAYYAGNPRGAGIRVKMEQIDALLRSRQRADGGWGNTAAAGSDSMVTSQVGYALDYLNPPATDPVIRKAVTLLLQRQQADGSWVSESNILATHLAATTWVEIWLPVALDRIGGIDTDLTLSLAGTVQLSNPLPAATETVSNPDGSAVHRWKLQGVVYAGRDIRFDLKLAGLVPDETRPAATEAYLTFNNSFTQQPVQASIAIPRITASAFLSLGVGTDRPSYGPNAPVAITGTVANTGGSYDRGTVRFEIVAADDSLVADLGPVAFSGLQAGGQHALEIPWNTGTTMAGAYSVRAGLYDPQQHLLGTARSDFRIVAFDLPSPEVGAKVTTDKASYSPTDTVQLTDRIVNFTANLALEGLTATTTVTHPDGSLFWTQTEALPQMVPSTLKDLNYNLPLAMAPAGEYAVSLVVTDGQGQELTRSATRFTVLSTADTGSGLTGVLTATPGSATIGDPVNLQLGVDNLGNADLNGLPITLTVVDPQAQTQLAGWSYATDLMRQSPYRNNQTWASAGLAPGTYVAVLSASVAGNTKVLAHANITLTEPPIRFTLDDGIDQRPRLLVWLGCQDQDEDDHGHDEETDDHHRKAQRAIAQHSGRHDDHGEDEATCGCNDGRLQALEAVLDRLGVRYRIVRHAADFRSAFRSGRYNIYWLSRGAEELPENLAGELREAVYRGDGLLLEGGLEHDGHRLDELGGVTYVGKLDRNPLPAGEGRVRAKTLNDATGSPPTSSPRALNLDGPLFTPGRLPVQGDPIRLRVTDGLVQAHFDDGAPAIVSHDFGSGHVLTLAFDGVGNLATQTDAAWPAWAQQAFDALQPSAVPTPFLPRAYLPLQTHIQNQGQATDLRIETVLPAGFALLDSNPAAADQGSGRWLQALHLAVGQQPVTELGFRLPETFGVFEITTTACSSGTNPVLREAHLSVEIANREALAKTLTDALKTLKLNRVDGKQRDHAVEAIREAQSAWKKADAETAIDRLLEAAEALRRIGGAGLSTELLQLDRLLQAAELQWKNLARPVCSGKKEEDDVSVTPDAHQSTESEHAHR